MEFGNTVMQRQLTTTNNPLRVLGAGDLSFTFGQAASAMMGEDTLGSLALNLFDERGGFSDEQRQRMDAAIDALQSERRGLEQAIAFPGALEPENADAIHSRIQDLYRQEADIIAAEEQVSISEGRMLSADDLRTRYADTGLTFDRAMGVEEAEALVERNREREVRRAIIERGPGGIAATIGLFGAGILNMATDPLEVATMFIPIVGPAGRAAAVARFGAVGGRVAVGAAEGLGGQLITEPAFYALSVADQADYTMYDAALTVGVGVVFGSAVGGVAGLLARRAEARVAPDQPMQLTPDMRVESTAADLQYLREVASLKPGADIAIRQAVNGNVTNVSPAVRPVNLDEIIARVDKEIARAGRGTGRLPEMPLASAIRNNIGIHPDGNFARELRDAGVTPKTFPGLFRKTGHRDMDNIPASEFDGIYNGMRELADPGTGYIDPARLFDALVSELQYKTSITSVPTRADVIAAKETDAQSIVARRATLSQIRQGQQDGTIPKDLTDAELQIIETLIARGQDLDRAVERSAIMSVNARDATELAQWAEDMASDPVADVQASRAVDNASSVSEVDAIAHYREMLEAWGVDVDVALSEVDVRLAGRVDAVQAAAVCFARQG